MVEKRNTAHVFFLSVFLSSVHLDMKEFMYDFMIYSLVKTVLALKINVIVNLK